MAESVGSPEMTRIRVGDFRLWVRSEPKAEHWDRKVTQPILNDDEYLLHPIAQSGEHPRLIFDIGSHVGAFTLLAKHLWPRARVVAADPDPDSAALFRRNTEALEGVHFHQRAVVGNGYPSVVHLRQGRFNWDHNAAASRVSEVVRPLHPEAAPPTTSVEAIGILDLLEIYGRPTIDILKLDCEGAEGDILQTLAAAGRMRTIRWIRGEWHFHGNLPKIEQALRDTHEAFIHRSEDLNGAFRARLREDR